MKLDPLLFTEVFTFLQLGQSIHLNYLMFITLTYRVSLTINNNPLQIVLIVKDLGVIFDCQHCFNLHIVNAYEAKGVRSLIKR